MQALGLWDDSSGSRHGDDGVRFEGASLNS